jgi:hypothetical protein
MDVLVRILRFKIQELRHHQVGHAVFDRTDDEHHPLFQQA